MSFTDEVKAWAEDTEARISRFRRVVVVRLFTMVIVTTPVDTGKLRDNWLPSINVADENDYDQVRGLDVSLAHVEDVAARLQGDDTAILRNNRPYAVAIERGHSAQAPQGMMDLSVARFPRTAAEEMRKEGLA
jgi:hypothetical protein